MGLKKFILLSIILILYIPKGMKCQSSNLKCYVCNSNYKKCGDADNFDSSVQSPTFCYGNCLKIVVSPGDFIIRSCSTFYENSFLIKNITSSKTFALNQCYIGSYHDPASFTIRESYVCFCNDKTGCNMSKSINQSLNINCIFLISLFVSILVNQV